MFFRRKGVGQEVMEVLRQAQAIVLEAHWLMVNHCRQPDYQPSEEDIKLLFQLDLAFREGQATASGLHDAMLARIERIRLDGTRFVLVAKEK